MVNRVFVYILSVGFISALVFAAKSDELVAPTVADAFSRFGIELLTSNPEQLDTALVFLQGGILLDEQSGAGYEPYLRGAGRTCQGRQDYRDPILQTLQHYLDYKADLDVASQALACVIDQTDSRQEREAILFRMLSPVAAANPAFGSDIAAQLGLYAVEKTDYASAIKLFEYAVQLNPYNLTAQAKVMELREPQTANADFIERLNWLRLKLAVNPADLQAAVEFGQTAYQAQLYEAAADAFEYAANLFKMVRPGAALHQEIAVGLAESCYWTSLRASQSLAVAEQVRQSGQVNLTLEAAAGLAAQKLGKPEVQSGIIATAASKAENQYQTDSSKMSAYEIGWFYSFVAESPEKSLAWCNNAYKQSPDAPGHKSMMAYAFWLNQQDELAEEYAAPLAEKDPVAMLTLAQLYIKKDQKQKAADLLNQANKLYVPLPVALKIKDLIAQIGLEGVSHLSEGLILDGLAAKWGEKLIPPFTSPDKLFSVKLKFEGEEFFYGNPLNASLVVENISKQPLIISPNGLITGRYRVDAEIRGDLTLKIPQLVERTFRPSRALMPGETISTRVNLNTGLLAKTLFTYPQADLTIDFKLYIDPISDSDATPRNAIQGFGIIQSVVHRKKIELAREFLVQRLDALAKGQEGQKIRSAELFCGLYAEQIAAQSGKVPYKYIAVNAPLLIDSIRRGIMDENWKVQTHLLLLLAQYSLYLDYAMTDSISTALNHEKWPERMIALWLLGQHQKEVFQPVLDWTVENDSFWLNRQLSKAMGAKVRNIEVKDPNTAQKQ